MSDNLKHCPDVLTIDEMCGILKISTKTGYRLLREGRIGHLKIGRAYRVPKAYLEQYLRGGEADGGRSSAGD